MKNWKWLTLIMILVLLAACDKQEVETSEFDDMVALSVSVPYVSESDESTEITRSSAAVPAVQTVTIAAGNGMMLEV